ncbi:MAG: alanine racemase [Marinilabiliales bacterium]|nr:MAG: alanine racemase [Marinilabiliales bacterium]
MKISKPTLLIDRYKVASNIDKMIKKAAEAGCVFRPHFKTHQSKEVGKIFREKGVNEITVSSVSMAEYFAEDGWNDITIAFPCNILEIYSINNLAKEVELNLMTDSNFTGDFLSKNLTSKCGLFIKIDIGYNRSGLEYNSPEIDEIIKTCEQSNNLIFKGFLTHDGRNYSAIGKAEIERNLVEAINIFKRLKQKYPGAIFSWGDTPSCSLVEDLGFFDELRPGNFVYYDVMQYHIGSCSLDEIAVAVACPVVSINKSRSELVVYGGAVHLSKEFIAADNNFTLFGYVVNIENNKWLNPINGAYVARLSQEHGIIKMPPKELEKFKPGDIVGILPIHSCLTANLLPDNYIIV